MDQSAVEFQWKKHPEATQLIQAAVNKATASSAWLAQFSTNLYRHTGSRLLDWIDRIVVQEGEKELENLGFSPVLLPTEPSTSPPLWRLNQAKLPDVVSAQSLPANTPAYLAIKTESIVDLMVTHQRNDVDCPIIGQPGAPMRRVLLESGEAWEIWGIERHGWSHWTPVPPDNLSAIAEVAQSFRCRPRDLNDDDQGFDTLELRLQQAIDRVGVWRACDEFFAAERAYWQGKNQAGRIQYARQQQFGLGWANHDHHTYRSSRHCFHRLVHVLEMLGLECRERFYAGREAGWGAQVMEQPYTGIIVFADVDLAPDEIVRDFSHEPLPPRQQLGTVGLWCALHGEAILQAGMHHLECQFDFEAARSQLASLGANSMNPFTDLPHLRQSFTVGERWSVRENRVVRAVQHGWITEAQADTFLRDGAIGSHLEVLQRNDGFKGFNPKGISDIILETDPRGQ